MEGFSAVVECRGQGEAVDLRRACPTGAPIVVGAVQSEAKADFIIIDMSIRRTCAMASKAMPWSMQN